MPRPCSVRFGRFRFDAASGELWMDGIRVPLQPQPSRLLALLLAKPGEVVTRDEIRALLWGDEVNVDFDRSLNFCVARLRAALGDTAAAPQFIETLPTRGYRFVPRVETAESSAEYAHDAEATTPAAEHADYAGARPAVEHADDADGGRPSAEFAEGAAGRTGLSLRSVTLMVALAVLAVVALRVFSPWNASAPKVVVVPFQNETGSSDFDRVAKGVSDATVVRLAASNGVRVIGNASGLRLSFRPPDMKAMGESLGAEYLVLGQMKRDSQRMRIIAHLIRVRDQTHVWAHTYDTSALDLPQQTSIADEIAAAVALRIGRS
jgi:TolB-like protein/DNA-binding winged helix-turn-helix (wHTH) protein